MKLYAQQGSGTGTKITEGLSLGLIDGAILSPKDDNLEKISTRLDEIAQVSPGADRLFDPQFYASFLAMEEGARLGKLTSGEYDYFSPRRRSQLESEDQIRADIKAVLGLQIHLMVTHVISPNIVIPHSLDSSEAVIAKNFIRNAQRIWSPLNDSRPLLATLAIGAPALTDRAELERFLSDLTILSEPPNGFYVLVCHESSSPTEQLVDSRALAGWMFLNHSLSLNGFTVINGFSDLLSPFLCAAGGTAGATGWDGTLKTFSLDRFEPTVGGGQPPTPRYLSCGLLNRIKFDELHRLRSRVPSVLNDLPSDASYPEAGGSLPSKPVKPKEMLQNWEAIQSLGRQLTPPEFSSRLRICKGWVDSAKALYTDVGALGGIGLPGRSNDKHLESLHYGIQMFADFAEIDLAGN